MKMMIGLFEGRKKFHVKLNALEDLVFFGTLSFKCLMYEMHKRLCALVCDFECLLIKFGTKGVMEH